jgi:2-succinyl-6-hydroxy-2,4-cyclohexadiene-1-carboxylate synthase
VRRGGQDVGVEDVVLLHGFSQTHRAFDGVIAALPVERYRPLAPDLPGHGAAGDRRSISFASCIDDLASTAPASFALCGYSQGGRIALHFALAHPDRVRRLMLISTTAGIEDPAARAARSAADEELAARIEREPLADFVTRWRDQPLFAGEPPAVRAAAVADQLRNTPAGLAAALRGLGTGAMQPVWTRLGELAMPVTVLAGERDEKFTALGRRLAAALPAGRLVLVDGAGHALPLEAPASVARALGPGD